MNLEQIVLRVSRHPHSPLFARLASEYLNSGRLSEALELCESGLREHPGYATGRLILAKCRAAESKYREALDILQTSSEWIPDSPIMLELQKEWETLVAGSPGPGEAAVKAEQAISETRSASPPPIPLESSQMERAAETSPSEEPAVKESPTAVREVTVSSPPIPRADIAASGILGTMPSPVIKTSGSPGSEGRIVSKTLAEIYATQGAYGEAIQTYRLLKQIRPELVPQIDRRIGELEGLSQVKPSQRG
ncbi:MAG TPA: tetratricopeptide repeat protein [Bacteroidota bacterium]|nr:tetratricopeptide repeat protein [Bacteroidota bacterium]